MSFSHGMALGRFTGRFCPEHNASLGLRSRDTCFREHCRIARNRDSHKSNKFGYRAGGYASISSHDNCIHPRTGWGGGGKYDRQSFDGIRGSQSGSDRQIRYCRIERRSATRPAPAILKVHQRPLWHTTGRLQHSAFIDGVLRNPGLDRGAQFSRRGIYIDSTGESFATYTSCRSTLEWERGDLARTDSRLFDTAGANGNPAQRRQRIWPGCGTSTDAGDHMFNTRRRADYNATIVKY